LHSIPIAGGNTSVIAVAICVSLRLAPYQSKDVISWLQRALRFGGLRPKAGVMAFAIKTIANAKE
jgi:hypothetical protein